MIGRTIGTYRIEAALGQGGMGTVYRGLDLMLERPVAIKALRADVAASGAHVERFRQEAKTLARLLHANIATLYALLREGDDLYMVMEFVEGETFEAVLHRVRRLPADRALGLFGQALRGIGHAHARGIVHRDIKPANFMVTPAGTVKAMDFGIARLLGTSRMTQTRHAIGTAEYMAPEQVRAREVDARTDVYALGILLYELVTGRVPFEAPSSFETMQAHLQTPPPSPRVLTRDLPEAVEAAILTALAKDPADRHPSVAAFQAALADLMPGGPPVPLAALLGANASGTGALAEPSSEPTASEPTASEPTRPAPATVAAPAPPHEPDAPEDAPDIPEADPPAPEAGDAPATLVPTPTVAAETSAPPPTRLAAPRTPATALAATASVAPTVAAPSPAPETVLAPAPDRPASGADASAPRSPRRTIPPVALLAAAVAIVLAASVWALRPSAADAPVGPEAGIEAAEQETRASGGAGGGLSPTRSDAVVTPGPPPALAEAEASAPAQDIRPADRPEAEVARPEPDRRPAPTERTAPADRTRDEAPEPRRAPTPEPVAAPQTGIARVLVRPFGDVFVDGRRLARETNA
ncbi:MAG: protein kinase, partial [Bacteroidota bacterium]